MTTMDTSVEDPQLRKIRGLLAMAEGAKTEEEGAAFADKAVTLMAKWGIDQAMAYATTSQHSDILTSRLIQIRNPYSKVKSTMLYRVASAMRCSGVIHPDLSGKSYGAVTLVGFKSDIDRAEALYTSLLLQGSSQVMRVRPAPYEGGVNAYRTSWFLGFMDGAVTRVRAAEKRAVDNANSSTGNGADLVLVDRKRLVDAEYDRLFPHRKVSNSLRAGTGYLDGEWAGQSADISGPGVTQRRKAIGQ